MLRYSFAAVVGISLFAVSIIGCDSADSRIPSGRALPANCVIVVIGPATGDAASAGVCGGARRFAAAYPNVQCVIVTPKDDGAASLAAAVDEALTARPQAICMHTRNADARDVIERIRQKSVVLVTMGAPLRDPAIYGRVDVELADGAEILAKNLKSVMPVAVNSFGNERRERSYALFHADGRDQDASDTYARFVTIMSSQPELACLDERNTWSSGVGSEALIGATLERFASVEVIVTLDPEPWSALPLKFRLPARNHFATLGAAPRLWPRLESGEAVALVGPLDGDVGYAAMELAAQGIMVIPDAPTRRIVPCELVTKANLKDFAQRYANAANMKVDEIFPVQP